MSIPKYDEITKPALELLYKDSPQAVADVVNTLADFFELNEEERNRLLPSGRDNLFRNRTRWALFYLKHARLVETSRRGFYEITQRGRELSSQKPAKIDKQFLRRYPEFSQFIDRSGEQETTTASGEVDDMTPEEHLEAIHASLVRNLQDEILEQIKSMSPAFFESLVVDLLVRMGYGGSRKDAGKAIGHSGDGGIDGIIKEDKLGLDVIYIQAKRWESNVGRPTVQGFAGSLEGVRAKRGIIITTSSFTNDAIDYVRQIEKKIVLIDGEMLTRLMLEHDLGVSVIATYSVKKMDIDYFSEE